jgi:hypothetical protein
MQRECPISYTHDAPPLSQEHPHIDQDKFQGVYDKKLECLALAWVAFCQLIGQPEAIMSFDLLVQKDKQAGHGMVNKKTGLPLWVCVIYIGR